MPPSHLIAQGLRSLLLGEDPLDIDRLWHKMVNGTRYFGGGGPAVHAISGVDIALWDLAGKILDKPVGQLLGGFYTERLRAYASLAMPDTPGRWRWRPVLGFGFPRRSSSAGVRSGRISRSTSPWSAPSGTPPVTR